MALRRTARTAVPTTGQAAAPPADSLALGDLRGAALKGLRSTVIARPVSELILLSAMVTLARLVSPADFGRFAIATLVCAFGQVPLSGLSVALIQRAELRREHLQAGLALALALTAVLLALTLLAANVVVAPIFGDRTRDFVELSALGFVLSAINVVPASTLQRRLAIRRLSVLDVVGSASGAAASVGFALAGFGGYALVIGGLAGTFSQTALNWAWSPAPWPALRRDAARELIKVAAPQGAAAVAWVGFANIDYAIVGARLGVAQSGYYSRAYTIGVIYQGKVSQVINTVGFPMLSRARTDADLRELRRQMVQLLTAIMFPGLALLSILAPTLLPWALGAKWGPAVVPTQLLVVGGAVGLIDSTVGAVLMARGRSRAVLGFGWAHFASYALIVWAATRFGIVGVAAAASADHVLFLLIAYAVMLRPAHRPPLRELWLDIEPAVIACTGLICVALPLDRALTLLGAPTLVHLALTALAGIGAYAATLRTARPASWRLLTAFATRVLPAGRLRARVHARTHTDDPADALRGGALDA